MLRLLFVFAIIATGVYYSTQGAFYILLFYLWNGYFRPEDWVYSSIIFQLRLSLLIGAALVVASIPWITRIRLTIESTLILLFMLQSTISWAMSPWSAWSTYYLVEFTKVVVVTILITVLVDDLKKFRLVLMVIAFSLGLEAAKQGWAQMIINTGAPNANPHLVLGDRNGVALGMMMLVPIFIALARTTSSVWERRLHRFFLVGVLYRGISTYSRGGLLAAAAAGTFYLSQSRHRFRALLAVAVLAVGMTALMPQQFWDRMGTIAVEDEQRDASATGRLYFWELAGQMASDRPLTGVGFNAYRFAYRSYDTSGGAHGSQRAVHSVWFGLLADLGYPGLLIFVALVLVTLWRAQRIKTTAVRRGLVEVEEYASVLQIGVVAFCVGGTFLTFQYVEMIWHFFALGVALTHISQRAFADEAVPQTDPAGMVPRVPAPEARLPARRPMPAESPARSRFFARQTGQRS